jgi:hypothetical protein
MFLKGNCVIKLYNGGKVVDKKPLIGVSICAVVLLVLGSLSNVVGYQSVKSTAVNDSPLFSVRTKRAINQVGGDTLTFNYLGKGQYSMPFPVIDNRTELIQKVIDRIKTMDDDTFNRFIDYAVNQINHKDNLKDINVKEFIKELRQLRKSTENIRVYKDKNDDNRTYLYNFVRTACWVPGCILIMISLLGALFLLWVYFILVTSQISPTYSISGCCMYFLG